MRSIFIQISSYHDYELERTIRDAIAKSTGDNKLCFGVHSIFYDDNKWLDPIRDIPNVKLVESKAPDNLGIGLGRHFAHQFYNGQDYYFQIDAHSRFDYGWDAFLINEVQMHKNNGHEKPIITNYPKPYWYEGDEETKRKLIEPVTQFYWKYKDRFELHRQPMQGTVHNPIGNIHSISISGGCIFTEGEFLKPNKLIFADGEEIFLAARAYTSGYDLFVPSQTFMYHLYSDRNSTGRNSRRLVTHDWVDETYRLEAISKEEINLVLRGDGVTGEYRLGTERTLDEYGKFCGLDFRTGEILDNYYEFS